MPKNMMRRGRIYYLRQRIPTDLLEAYGKAEIVISLKTSDPKEARIKLPAQQLHLQTEFKAKRSEILSRSSERSLNDLGEEEILSMVIRAYQEQYAKNEKGILARNGEDENKEEVIETLREELGDSRRAVRERHDPYAFRFLETRNITYDPKSDKYRKLSDLLARSHHDLTMRVLQRYTGEPAVGSGDHLFSQALNQKIEDVITFGQLCDLYEKSRIDQAIKPRSLKQLQEEIKRLKDFIPSDTPAHKINRKQCRDIFDTIKLIPANASKIYPGKSISTAIELAQKDGTPLLSPRTINGYITRLSSIFKFALEENLISHSPAGNLRKLDSVAARDKRLPFSIDDLSVIFGSPLYTGCVDDKYNYNKPGSEKPRRSRFWIPLIALWTGMRMEEICSLHASDIQKHEDIYFIKIHRVIKTKNSYRFVPIHPELKRCGFIDMIEDARKRENDHLFPDLQKGGTGTYSHEFSKWFGRFRENLNIEDQKKVFHSFRHTFRDALTQAEIPIQFVRAIGGWSGGGMDELYGSGPHVKKLYTHLEKIQYVGLDLSHLYVNKPSKVKRALLFND